MAVEYGRRNLRELDDVASDGWGAGDLPVWDGTDFVPESRLTQDAAVALLQTRSEKNQANGYPGLDGAGKVQSAALPALAVSSVSVVTSQAAQLALTVEEGDVAVRSDQNKSYVRNSGSAGTMADWTELQTPGDAVLSVASKTGAVTLVKGDVGLGSVDDTSDADKPVSAAQQLALDAQEAALDAHAAGADPHPNYALESQVPSLDELFASSGFIVTITEAAFPSGLSLPIFTAPYALQVTSARVVNYGASIALHATDYWWAGIRRKRANVSTDVAVKTTLTGTGEAVTIRTDWNFNAVAFDAGNKVLQAGDSIDMTIAPVGPGSSAGSWINPVVTVGYTPV